MDDALILQGESHVLTQLLEITAVFTTRYCSTSRPEPQNPHPSLHISSAFAVLLVVITTTYLTGIFKMASRSESQESGVNEDLDSANIVKVDEPVGNLSKYYALPPGFSGTPKKGHLMFDACFESGNLGRVDYITEFEYDLFIRPDTCNPRFRVWFNFTVENTAPYQRVIFNVVNFSKTKSLYREGMTPLVKSSSRPKWQRIPAKNCFYYRCPDHRKNYVLSFAFAFDSDTDVYQFAYCFPYTYSRLQTFLEELDKKEMACYRRELLCLTVQQRRVDLLTVTSPENMKDDLKKRVIFITARIHPGKPFILLRRIIKLSCVYFTQIHL